jgi:hypothetical protein
METDIATGEKEEKEEKDEDEEEEEGTIMPVRGPLPPAEGKWASCIRVIEPATGTSREVLELSNNEVINVTLIRDMLYDIYAYYTHAKCYSWSYF